MKQPQYSSVDGAGEVFSVEAITGQEEPIVLERNAPSSCRARIAGFIRYQVVGRTVCIFRGHRRGATFVIGDVQTSVCDRCLRKART